MELPAKLPSCLGNNAQIFPILLKQAKLVKNFIGIGYSVKTGTLYLIKLFFVIAVQAPILRQVLIIVIP